MQRMMVEIVEDYGVPVLVLALQGYSAYSMLIRLDTAKTRRGRRAIERWVDSIFLLEDGIDITTAEALLDSLDFVLGQEVDAPKAAKPWARFFKRREK